MMGNQRATGGKADPSTDLSDRLVYELRASDVESQLQDGFSPQEAKFVEALRKRDATTITASLVTWEGKDEKFGHGRVEAAKQAAVHPLSRPPTSDGGLAKVAARLERNVNKPSSEGEGGWEAFF